MRLDELKTGLLVCRPALPRPVELSVVTPLGNVVSLRVAGQKTGQVRARVLHAQQLAFLEATRQPRPLAGNWVPFRLCVGPRASARSKRREA